MIDLQRETDKSTFIVGNFTFLLVLGKLRKQTIQSEKVYNTGTAQ